MGRLARPVFIKWVRPNRICFSGRDRESFNYYCLALLRLANIRTRSPCVGYLADTVYENPAFR